MREIHFPSTPTPASTTSSSSSCSSTVNFETQKGRKEAIKHAFRKANADEKSELLLVAFKSLNRHPVASGLKVCVCVCNQFLYSIENATGFFFFISAIDVQVTTVKKRAHLLREALVALAGAPSLSARGGHIPRRINSKKMLEAMLVNGKSIGRSYALMIQERIATASMKHNRRPPTPSSKGSSKLGTPKSGFNLNYCECIANVPPS